MRWGSRGSNTISVHSKNHETYVNYNLPTTKVKRVDWSTENEEQNSNGIVLR